MLTNIVLHHGRNELKNKNRETYPKKSDAIGKSAVAADWAKSGWSLRGQFKQFKIQKVVFILFLQTNSGLFYIHVQDEYYTSVSLCFLYNGTHGYS